MIPKHRVWQILLLCMALVAIWFTGNAVLQLFRYFRVNQTTEAVVTQWSVKELASDRYVLNAHYTFPVENKVYEGETPFLQPHFLNSWAAEQAIPEWQAKERWTVWYSSWNPDYSTLQKSFPIKECVSAILLWGVLFYFIGLNYYAMHYLK